VGERVGGKLQACSPCFQRFEGDGSYRFYTGSFQEHDNFAKRVMDVETAGLKSTQFCHTHGGECPINKPVDVDMSGLPCEDNSTAGKRMYLHGRFGSCYLVWAKFHREMATPVLVLENTPAFWLY